MVSHGAASIALVHHANQYVITNGYANREGLDAVVGGFGSANGYLKILELHKRYQIPLNLHVSGTLLEALLWHRPDVLFALRELRQGGLLELIGSSYGQNIMRFFSDAHNMRQLRELLALYGQHLEVDPRTVMVFWLPERVWDTEKLAKVLSDPWLPNGGYRYVLIDDRLLYPSGNGCPSRSDYDRAEGWHVENFGAYEIFQGRGLIALPIARTLRQTIPPDADRLDKIHALLGWLSCASLEAGPDLLGVYADDLEKASGVGGWDPRGPGRYEALLQWISATPWVRSVRLTDWARQARLAGVKPIEVGTYVEMSRDFGAGEGYGNWYFAPGWDPYRSYFQLSEAKLDAVTAGRADPVLIELGWKHLLASAWQTAWHTPLSGVHGNPSADGRPSPWIRAIASHSRSAGVIAEAAYWMSHKDKEAHAYAYDIDNDGVEELVLTNDRLFAVLSPKDGGRLVYLFSVHGTAGRMVVGNPCDDWNWLEELNAYMDVPRNHPGALADVGFEHDRYKATVLTANGQRVEAELQNHQCESPGRGLVKRIVLSYGSNALRVSYTLPDRLPGADIEFGLSPDYLSLLRSGRGLLREYTDAGARGWSAGGVTVWIKPEPGDHLRWTKPYQEEFGHGRSMRLTSTKGGFSLWVGVDVESPQV